MLDFQILFSSKFMQDLAMPIRRRTSPLLPPEESIMLYPDRQRRRPFQHVHLPPGLLSKAWMGEPGVFWFSTSLSEDQIGEFKLKSSFISVSVRVPMVATEHNRKSAIAEFLVKKDVLPRTRQTR